MRNLALFSRVLVVLTTLLLGCEEKRNAAASSSASVRHVAPGNPVDAGGAATSSASSPIDPGPPPIAKPHHDVVARGLVEPSSLTVSKGKVFVTVHGKPATTQDAVGAVMVVPESGGEAKVIVGEQRFPEMLLSDDAAIYWRTLGSLWALPVDDAAPKPPTLLYRADVGVVFPFGLDENDVYFSLTFRDPEVKTMRDGNLLTGGIYAVKKSGGQRRALLEKWAFVTTTMNKYRVFSCDFVSDGRSAIGSTSRRPSAADVQLRSHGGGGRLKSGMEHEKANCSSLAADEDKIVWADSGVWAQDLLAAPGESTRLAEDNAREVAISGGYVYWWYEAAKGDVRIKRTKTTGGTTELLAQHVGEITRMRVAPPYVYWISKHAGTLSRVSLPPEARSPSGPSSAAPSASASSIPAISYRGYANEAFGYSVDVASIFTGGVPFMGAAGQEWKWGKEATMNIASIDGKGWSIVEWYNAAKGEKGFVDGGVRADWFFKTGVSGGRIFWQKSILRGPRLYTVRLEYAESLKAAFDPIVARVAQSLRAP